MLFVYLSAIRTTLVVATSSAVILTGFIAIMMIVSYFKGVHSLSLIISCLRIKYFDEVYFIVINVVSI